MFFVKFRYIFSTLGILTYRLSLGHLHIFHFPLVCKYQNFRNFSIFWKNSNGQIPYFFGIFLSGEFYFFVLISLLKIFVFIDTWKVLNKFYLQRNFLIFEDSKIDQANKQHNIMELFVWFLSNICAELGEICVPKSAPKFNETNTKTDIVPKYISINCFKTKILRSKISEGENQRKRFERIRNNELFSKK